MLRYFLENGLINITDKHPQNWEEAIRISGEIMKKNNLVTDEYIDQVIADVKKYGPYIVIVPGVAMPHSSAENSGVLGTGLCQIPFRLKKATPKKMLVCSLCWRLRTMIPMLKIFPNWQTC